MPNAKVKNAWSFTFHIYTHGHEMELKYKYCQLYNQIALLVEKLNDGCRMDNIGRAAKSYKDYDFYIAEDVEKDLREKAKIWRHNAVERRMGICN